MSQPQAHVKAAPDVVNICIAFSTSFINTIYMSDYLNGAKEHWEGGYLLVI